MATILEGDFSVTDKKFGIVVSRFNSFICDKLLEGAINGLTQHGVADKHITVAWTPGAFEIPLVAHKMAGSGTYSAVITLGCVIRGATPHFDYVAGEAARGIREAGARTGIPVIFGVLTTDTVEQAIERAGDQSSNKGFDAAMAAIEMANLMEKM
jgi:6,7-dimethyl-8-ribityllumazine synthase